MKKVLTLSNEIITINGHPVRKIYGGFGENQPCILAKQVAELHGQELKEINRIVNRNKDWIDQGIDIIDLKDIINDDITNYALRDIRNLLLSFYSQDALNASKYIYLFSQQGYVLLCKFLKSDIARQVYKSVIREYFSTDLSDRWLDCLPNYTRICSVPVGYVYVLRNPIGKVKIGRSREPMKRIRDIQTQGGFLTDKIFISDKIRCYKVAENMLHEIFQNQRFIGEWFDIGFEDAVSTCRKVINSMEAVRLSGIRDEDEARLTANRITKETTGFDLLEFVRPGYAESVSKSSQHPRTSQPVREEEDNLIRFVSTWWEKYGDNAVDSAHLLWLASDANLPNLDKGNEKSRKIRLGKMLSKLKGKQVGSYIITDAGKHRNIRLWKLRPAEKSVIDS